MTENLLKIESLCKSFHLGGFIFGTKIMAVDCINLALPKNKPWIMSIVGESGSGKTTLARMILGLLDKTSGSIEVDGKKFNNINRKEFYRFVQPIFQNPFSAFSSRKKVDTYLYETAVNVAGCKNKEEAEKLIDKKLYSVGLEPKQIMGKYSNQFSGGELQRISIARALIPDPKLIIADEPVAMIDASLRMNVVNLFKKLRDEYNVSFVYVTHDLSTAYYVSDYIATMYRGNIIEFGNARGVLENPLHPYTELLLDSIPKVGQKWSGHVVLPSVETREYLKGKCKFSSRCKYVMEECKTGMPEPIQINKDHMVLCSKYVNEHVIAH